MRLTRWQQIAVVLSLAWMVGSGAYEWSASTARARSKALAEYENCIEIHALTGSLDLSLCSQRASRTLEAERKGSWRNAATVVLGAPAMVWMTIFAIFMVGHLPYRRP